MQRRVWLAFAVGLLACGPASDAPDPAHAEWERLASLGYVREAGAETRSRDVVQHDPARAQPGWNLYSSRTAAQAWLIDMQGHVHHGWRGADDAPGWNHVEWIGDGGLLVLTQAPSVLRLDREGRVQWERALAAHHDAWIAADGSIYTLERTETAAPGDGRSLLGENLLHLSADGTVLARLPIHDAVANWLGEEHLDRIAARAVDPRSFAQRLRAGFAPLPLDALHANSLERLPRDVPGLGRTGDWLVSLRNLDRVVVIAPTGERRATLGAGVVERQHHATLTRNDRVLLFDNGRDRDSRVLELDPRSGAVAWSHAGTRARPLRSRSQGGAERLANGNTLIVESDRGRALEVTPAGEIVWEFLNPATDAARGTRASIYRMTRLPLSAWPRP